MAFAMTIGPVERMPVRDSLALTQLDKGRRREVQGR